MAGIAPRPAPAVIRSGSGLRGAGFPQTERYRTTIELAGDTGDQAEARGAARLTMGRGLPQRGRAVVLVGLARHAHRRTTDGRHRVPCELVVVIDALQNAGGDTHIRLPKRAPEAHLSHRAGWLRAAVLGANDGIVSTASLVLGVAAAGESTGTVVTAGIAGLVAGALSMASGEYVSVSSQRDAEQADIAVETRELRDDPEGELRELATIYERRGLPTDLARRVAETLSAGGALRAHVRDELGLSQERMARPLQAAWASALSFSAGAVVPLLAIAFIGGVARVAVCIVVTTLALASLGGLGARLGGAPAGRAATRVVTWGLIAMGATAAIGALVGTVG